MRVADTFHERSAPETERRAIQLTDGPGFHYPLYYYVPSLTDGSEYLVYHRARGGEVQLHRLHLPTGETAQLTDASAADTHWRPWCTDPGEGVLDHRSVLNVARGEVIYFDGNEVRAVDVESLNDRRLFALDDDRRPIGQNCVTPDGEWFVYIHHDRESFEKVLTEGRHHSEETVLAAYRLDSGEHRTLVRIDSPIHHVLPYDDERLIFCHPTMENGMLLTDLDGGWYTHMRTRDEYGGAVCHHLATDRGIAYDVLGGSRGVRGGLYDPATNERVEVRLPDEFGYTHAGYDPAGRLLLFENQNAETDRHDMWYLARYRESGDQEWNRLIGHWPTYGGGQKAHFHPRMTPDRNWIIFTAGDPERQANQIYLLDVSDLSHTSGLPDVTA